MNPGILDGSVVDSEQPQVGALLEQHILSTSEPPLSVSCFPFSLLVSIFLKNIMSYHNLPCNTITNEPLMQLKHLQA